MTLPASTSSTAGPAGSIRMNPGTGRLETYTSTSGGRWEPMMQPFLTRQIITTGYLQGGYAASVAWNNTNRITVATDTTVNLGDGTQERSHNYQSAAHNRTRSFTFGAGNGHCVASNQVICFNMRTETAQTSGYTRTLPVAQVNTSTVQQEEFFSWTTSAYGSNAIYEWNLTTETLTGTTSSTSGSPNGGTSHETYGVFTQNNQIWTYATRTLTARGGTAMSGDGMQHILQFKRDFQYGGREGNPSTNWRESNMITNTSYDAIGAKPAYSGEENHIIGQDWGYCLGFYNGGHVNTSYKFVYSTKVGYLGGTSMEPKGKSGNSSGTVAWRD